MSLSVKMSMTISELRYWRRYSSGIGVNNMGKGYLSGSPSQVESIWRKEAAENDGNYTHSSINCQYKRRFFCMLAQLVNNTEHKGLCVYWKCEIYRRALHEDNDTPNLQYRCVLLPFFFFLFFGRFFDGRRNNGCFK